MMSPRLLGSLLTRSKRCQQPLLLESCREEPGRPGSFPERPCSLRQAQSHFLSGGSFSLRVPCHIAPHRPHPPQSSPGEVTQLPSSLACSHPQNGPRQSLPLRLTSNYMGIPRGWEDSDLRHRSCLRPTLCTPSRQHMGTWPNMWPVGHTLLGL